MSLDPMPSAAELLRMAQERGVLPPNGPVAPRSARTTPFVRPWHPYRNKWEHEYATQHLRIEKAAGLIQDYGYETERLEIGTGAFYTPDFPVTMADGTREMREVKGFRREAAMVRLRVAAARYPQFRFVLVTKRRGQWHHETIR